MSSFPSDTGPKSSRRSKYTPVAWFSRVPTPEIQGQEAHWTYADPTANITVQCSGEDECALCRRRGARCVYPTEGRYRITRRKPSATARETINPRPASSISSSSSSSSRRSTTSSHPRNWAGHNEIPAAEPNPIQLDSFNGSSIMPVPAFDVEASTSRDRAHQLEATLRLIAELTSRSVASSSRVRANFPLARPAWLPL
ncbi:hypothetical protein QWA68_014844 [Fusarium oxysporum]|nr:hypothetical protein QWA68_014844 [Fusarium oxysporum]